MTLLNIYCILDTVLLDTEDYTGHHRGSSPHPRSAYILIGERHKQTINYMMLESTLEIVMLRSKCRKCCLGEGCSFKQGGWSGNALLKWWRLIHNPKECAGSKEEVIWVLKNQCAWCRVSETVRGDEVWEVAGPGSEVLLVSHWMTCTFILSKGNSLEAQATITNYGKLGGLHNRDLFSHSSAGWKSEIRVLLWLFRWELSSWFAGACCFLCLHMAHVCAELLSRVQLFATLWTIAHQASLSMGFSRQAYWSGLTCPPPEPLLDPGIESTSPATPALQWILYCWASGWVLSLGRERQSKLWWLFWSEY